MGVRKKPEGGVGGGGGGGEGGLESWMIGKRNEEVSLSHTMFSSCKYS